MVWRKTGLRILVNCQPTVLLANSFFACKVRLTGILTCRYGVRMETPKTDLSHFLMILKSSIILPLRRWCVASAWKRAMLRTNAVVECVGASETALTRATQMDRFLELDVMGWSLSRCVVFRHQFCECLAKFFNKMLQFVFCRNIFDPKNPNFV